MKIFKLMIKNLIHLIKNINLLFYIYKRELSTAKFAILKNYEIYNFYPIIAIVIYVFIVILVNSLFYYLTKEIFRKIFEKKIK